MNRGLPLWVEGGSSGIGLDWVGHGLAVGPAWYRIAGRVGYLALVATVGFHVCWGWAQWLGFGPEQVSGRSTDAAAKQKSRRRFWMINAGSAVVTWIWLAGGMGVVGRNGRVAGWVGRHYDDLLRHLPFLRSYV